MSQTVVFAWIVLLFGLASNRDVGMASATLSPFMDLTTRQQEILAFIRESQRDTGVMPSTREIQVHFGFASQTAAVKHLQALERKGMIHRQPHKARAMALTPSLRRQSIIDIPVYGKIPPTPEPLVQKCERMVSMDAVTTGVHPEARLFAMKVHGDSMVDAHIVDGDLVVLEPREPRNGEVVAALVDGETTLKRFVVNGGQSYLKAENSLFSNLVPANELRVQGVMVALVRGLRN